MGQILQFENIDNFYRQDFLRFYIFKYITNRYDIYTEWRQSFFCLDKFPQKVSPYSLINRMETNQLVDVTDYILLFQKEAIKDIMKSLKF